ncbi:MAG: hypothetical protein ACRYE7_00265 [Janthinobacterium lividum]
MVNGEKLNFVSLRMAETQLLSIYLRNLHEKIYTCASFKGHIITADEARLLNNINKKHADCVYGNENFFAGKDYIARLEDVHQYYIFLDVCYQVLINNIYTGLKTRCGFITINSKLNAPYCIINNQKYIPIFYFDCETEKLIPQAIKLENWNLAYLKFCFTIMGIKKKFFASDSCTVISIDNLKNCDSNERNVEEYWPVVDTQLQTDKNSTKVNPPTACIIQPPKLVPIENNILQILTTSAPVQPQSMMEILHGVCVIS